MDQTNLGTWGVMSFTKESGGHFKDIECYYSPGLHKVWRQLLSFSLTLVPWNLPSYDCNQNQCNYSQEKRFLWNYLSIQVARDMISIHACLLPLAYASTCWSNLFKVSMPFPTPLSLQHLHRLLPPFIFFQYSSLSPPGPNLTNPSHFFWIIKTSAWTLVSWQWYLFISALM